MYLLRFMVFNWVNFKKVHIGLGSPGEWLVVFFDTRQNQL